MDPTHGQPTRKRRCLWLIVTVAVLLLIAAVSLSSRLQSQRLQREVVRLQERGIGAMVVRCPTRSRLLRNVPLLREFFGTDRLAIYLPSADAAWKLYLMPEVESLDSLGYASEKDVQDIIPMLRRKYASLRLRGEFPDTKSWEAIAPAL